MKKKDFKKLTPVEQAALRELMVEQPNSVGGVRRDQKKGYTDLPLFFRDDQTKLF
ncbi:hypothetical protein [Arundinibacter roseus]|uniref:hypothetical protein n=1 Tax=Arundinibacter roseus TaxID=2070510 RepID=UPI0014047EEB|nr:hypothetical protein [Arundinibacter roseus]